ncbi:hypothetical protein EZV62_026921 [Acer yangbiense]|uniref:Uncharacterized protein n=1 Tax=Acer yangbiense TaxID=1000413 RepID=A0A5C7GT11_9ROSI|nr:hypothetical protein EZV62_026921 [Acer yangbiense]
MAKEKAKMSYKMKPRVLPSVICDPKAKLIIENRHVDFRRNVYSSRSESSECEEMSSQGQFCDSVYFRGDNSKSCDGLSVGASWAEVERWVENNLEAEEVRPSSRSQSTSTEEDNHFVDEPFSQSPTRNQSHQNFALLNQSDGNELCVCVNSMFKGVNGSKGAEEEGRSRANLKNKDRKISKSFKSQERKSKIGKPNVQRKSSESGHEEAELGSEAGGGAGILWCLEEEIAKGCLVALDETHIKVRVSEKDKPRYRTIKGEVATNVLDHATGQVAGTPQHILDEVNSEGANMDGMGNMEGVGSPMLVPQQASDSIHLQSCNEMKELAASVFGHNKDMSDIADELATMGLELDDELDALTLILDKPSNISAFKCLKGARR